MQLKLTNGEPGEEDAKESVQVIITNEAPTSEQTAAFRRFWEMVLGRILGQGAT